MIVKVLGFVYIVAWSTYFVESVKRIGRGVIQRLKTLLSYTKLCLEENLLNLIFYEIFCTFVEY